MNETLSQSELEDLSAYMDDELSGADRDRVERLVETDARWREHYRQWTRVSDALEAWTAPAPPADLAERIIRNLPAMAPRRTNLVWARWLAPLAAAAAMIVAAAAMYVAIHGQHGTTVAKGPEPTAVKTVPATPPEQLPAAKVDEIVQSNLDFFSNYELLADLPTVEAVERQESQQSGT